MHFPVIFKNTCFLFCLFLAFSLSGQVQNNYGNFRGYTHSGTPVGGYFHHADATGVYYATSRKALRDPSKLKRIPLEDTQYIMVRRKGAVARGALIGFLGGLITGPVVGQSINTRKSYSNDLGGGLIYTLDSLEGVAAGLIIGPVVGAITGALIGSGKKRFLQGGKFSQRKAQERKLAKLIYRYR